MEKLATHHRLNPTLQALGYQAVRLASRAQTKALSLEVKAQRDQIEELARALQRAREERLGGTGEIAFCDQQLDKAVAKFVRRLRGELESEADPRYEALFSQNPSQAMSGIASQPQERFVRHLIRTIRAREELAEYASTADELERLQAELERATATREVLYGAEAEAAAQLRVALRAAQEAYNLRYAQLLLMFPKQPDLVESFFAPIARANRGSAGDPPDASDEEPDPSEV
jgi:hypothetical protein